MKAETKCIILFIIMTLFIFCGYLWLFSSCLPQIAIDYPGIADEAIKMHIWFLNNRGFLILSLLIVSTGCGYFSASELWNYLNRPRQTKISDFENKK